MVNMNDILARLQNGESADVIAQEMVDALNAANAQFAEEQAAAQKANDIAAQKAEFVEEMADIVRDYIMTFHADSYIAEMIADQEINPVEIVEMLDQSFEQLDAEIRKLKEIEKMFSGLMAKLDEHHPIPHADNCDCGCHDKATGKIEPNADALMGFLKANGLA
jgi:hypothetical protein